MLLTMHNYLEFKNLKVKNRKRNKINNKNKMSRKKGKIKENKKSK